MTWPTQCFQLSSELFRALTSEEVDATYADLVELKLANPPYEEFDLLIPESEVLLIVDEKGEGCADYMDDIKTANKNMRFRYLKDGDVSLFMYGRPKGELPGYHSFFGVMDNITHGQYKEIYEERVEKVANELMHLLIVLLATKNIVKSVKESKLMKLGIGNKEKNQYTTTLKIGEITEKTDTPSTPTGVTRRPHLRRGHIRRQHHGPRNEMIRTIWIAPIFVNADPNWIGERTAYNVSMAR